MVIVGDGCLGGIIVTWYGWIQIIPLIDYWIRIEWLIFNFRETRWRTIPVCLFWTINQLKMKTKFNWPHELYIALLIWCMQKAIQQVFLSFNQHHSIFVFTFYERNFHQIMLIASIKNGLMMANTNYNCIVEYTHWNVSMSALEGYCWYLFNLNCAVSTWICFEWIQQIFPTETDAWILLAELSSPWG